MVVLPFFYGAAAGALVTLVAAARIRRSVVARKCAEQTGALQNEVAVLQRESRREVKALVAEYENRLQSQAGEWEEVLRARVPIWCDFTSVRVEILNLEGDTCLTRTHRGLRAGENLGLTFMEHRIGSTGKENGEIQLALVTENSSAGVSLEIDRQKSTAQTCWFRVNFPPAAVKTPEGVHYQYRAVYPRGVLMTREQVVKEYAQLPFKQECVFHDNVLSTDHLEMEVQFPLGFAATFSGAIYLLGTWTRHQVAARELPLIHEPGGSDSKS